MIRVAITTADGTTYEVTEQEMVAGRLALKYWLKGARGTEDTAKRAGAGLLKQLAEPDDRRAHRIADAVLKEAGENAR